MDAAAIGSAFDGLGISQNIASRCIRDTLQQNPNSIFNLNNQNKKKDKETK